MNLDQLVKTSRGKTTQIIDANYANMPQTNLNQIDFRWPSVPDVNWDDDEFTCHTITPSPSKTSSEIITASESDR